jgi:hypothetical protein
MLVEDGATYGLFSTKSPHLREALRQMDTWLANMDQDKAAPAGLPKVIRHKPIDLVDACFDGSGHKIAEAQTYDAKGRCNALYPPHASPYLVAGMPITSDVVKCELKPVSAGDYTVTLTDDDMARVRRIFPTGVCDYSKPGVEQRALKGTWLSFGPSPLNKITAP